MKLNQNNRAEFEQGIDSLFSYYPAELIEAALMPLLAKKNDYCIGEPMNITHVFYAELNDMMQRCLLSYQQAQLKNVIPIASEPSKNVFDIIPVLTALIPVAYIFCKLPNHASTNLHIVLKQKEYKPFDEIEKAVAFSLIAYPKITCSVYAYGTMLDLMMKGHFYFSNLCIPANCIYQHDHFNLPSPNTELIATVMLYTVQVFTRHIHKAISFFEGAKRFLKNNEPAMVTFMLQQACEFAYRSLIVAFKGKDIKSHDLVVLMKHITIYEPQVIGLFNLKQKKEIKLLSQLNEAYVKARYDFTYQISNEQLLILIDATGNLLEGTQQLFKPYLSTQSSC